MDLATIAAVTAIFLAYSLVSGKLSGTIVTAPMLFVAIGFAAGPGGFGVVAVNVQHEVIHLIAELTLILVLFTDAARIDLGRVRRDHNLPSRMLLIGLPLTMLFGALVAAFLFPGFSFWEAALLAALLAPTDAALGQAVVSDKIVPLRIRQTINIESGLNDGIALPVVLLLAAVASAHFNASDSGQWLRFGLLQVTLGPLVGVVVGFAGARLIDTAAAKQWMGESSQGIAILALAIFAYAMAEVVGGNGFIATFVAGMVFGNAIRNACTFLFEFMETEGQLLMLLTFFIFGIALLPEGLSYATPMMFVYALLSLTVIRMLPIAISLLGAGLSPPSWLFLGWFGPRGIASILFVLLVLEEMQLPHRHELLAVTMITVALSVLFHGISAAPFAKLYGRLAGRMGECEESQVVTDLPLRGGMTPDESSE